MKKYNILFQSYMNIRIYFFEHLLSEKYKIVGKFFNYSFLNLKFYQNYYLLHFFHSNLRLYSNLQFFH